MKPKSIIVCLICVVSTVCPTAIDMLLSSRSRFDTTNSATAEGSETMYDVPAADCSLVSTSVRSISFAASRCPYFTCLRYDDGKKNTFSAPIICFRSL